MLCSHHSPLILPCHSYWNWKQQSATFCFLFSEDFPWPRNNFTHWSYLLKNPPNFCHGSEWRRNTQTQEKENENHWAGQPKASLSSCFQSGSRTVPGQLWFELGFFTWLIMCRMATDKFFWWPSSTVKTGALLCAFLVMQESLKKPREWNIQWFINLFRYQTYTGTQNKQPVFQSLH